MDIRNCIGCRRLYHHIAGENLCPVCAKEMDDKYKEVKIYLYEHPGASVAEVSEKMEVSVRQIQKWVREERLEFSEPSLAGIGCERCGKAITSGKYCSECKNELAHTLSSVYQSPASHEEKQVRGSKMRFL